MFLGAVSQESRALRPDLPRIVEEAKAAVLRFVILPQVIMERLAGFAISIAGQLGHKHRKYAGMQKCAGAINITLSL